MEASEHVLMDMRKDKWEPMGDVCAACSDPEAGIWVPVSFCPEAKKDADIYYSEFDLKRLAILTKVMERNRGNV